MARVGFHDLEFDEGFVSALRADGGLVRFTRQERALLGLLAAHPGRLFVREELFTALGSRGSDRNVDFVINRLRGKLADNGPERRFISTQYGEGYVWVASVVELAEPGGFFVIGPVRGLDAASANAVLRPLQDALQRRLGQGRPVRLAPDLDAVAAGGFRFSIEASFHAASACVQAAFVLRQEPSRTVVASFRERFDQAPPEAAIEALAGALADAAWMRLALGPPAAATPADLPLHLRLLGASVLLDPSSASWSANGEHIARLRERDGADPTLAILWATYLYGRMTSEPGEEPLDRQAAEAVEVEIEGLVFEHLAAIRRDPVMALAAAKLLLSIHRGHEALAESLATTVLAESAAFAAAFGVLGQIKAYRGDLAEARRLYDEGLKLCEPGSMFDLNIQVLKAISLIAEDDRAGVEAAYAQIVEISPVAHRQLGLLFLPAADDGLARRLAALADRTSARHARRAIAYLHYRVAPYFRSADQCANIMRGPLVHLVRRFGPSVASEAIWREMPQELHHLRGVRGASSPGA